MEFQPSSYSKGSYLNVGAMWLWNESNHLRFDDGQRIEKFVKFKNEDQFCQEAHRLAAIACERVFTIREKFATIGKASLHLVDHAETNANPWQWFHAAIAAAYAGNLDSARKNFKKFESWEIQYDWQKHLQDRARWLSSLLEDCSNFRQEIKATIVRTRELLKLRGPAEPWVGF